MLQLVIFASICRYLPQLRTGRAGYFANRESVTESLQR